jgi:hypothetical protein
MGNNYVPCFGSYDAVRCFQYKEDAEKVMVLPKRFAKYGLTLHPEKTRLVNLGGTQR